MTPNTNHPQEARREAWTQVDRDEAAALIAPLLTRYMKDAHQTAHAARAVVDALAHREQDAPAPEGAVDALRDSEIIDKSTFALLSDDGETTHPLTIGMYSSKKDGGFEVIFERATRPSAAPAAETGAGYESATDLADEMEAQAELDPGNVDCCNSRFPFAANARLLRDGAALIRRLCATPTQDAAHGGRG